MMGVYGMLALAFAVFALRYLIPENKWPEKGAEVLILGLEHRLDLDGLHFTSAAGCRSVV